MTLHETKSSSWRQSNIYDGIFFLLVFYVLTIIKRMRKYQVHTITSRYVTPIIINTYVCFYISFLLYFFKMISFFVFFLSVD